MFMMIGDETEMEKITDVLDEGGTIVVDRMDYTIDDMEKFVNELNDKLEAKYGKSLVFETDYAYTWTLRTA